MKNSNTSGGASAAGQKKRGGCLRALLIGLGLLVLLSALISACGGGDKEVAAPATTAAAPAATSAAPATTSAAPATKSAAPAATSAAPSKPADPMVSLKDALRAKLGASNRDVERVSMVKVSKDEGILTVQWAVNDNLTSNLIKVGARMDATNILQVVKESGLKGFDQVTLLGTFPMQDKLGNGSEQPVILAAYPMATVNKINFEGFDRDNIWDIATAAEVHDEFR